MSKRGTIDKLRWTPQSKLLLVAAVAVAWCWNWQLVLANGAGISLMLLVYCSKVSDWQRYRTSLEQMARGHNGRLIVAVASGVVAALVTYITASIWTAASDRWLAIGQIIQLLCVLIGTAVLLWQQLKSSLSSPILLDRLTVNLTAADPVARLIAIRQLTRKLLRGSQPQIAIEVLQYFQLMLLQAQETTVKQALYESIEKLQHRYPNISPPQPLPLTPPEPIKLTTKPVLRDWA